MNQSKIRILAEQGAVTPAIRVGKPTTENPPKVQYNNNPITDFPVEFAARIVAWCNYVVIDAGQISVLIQYPHSQTDKIEQIYLSVKEMFIVRFANACDLLLAERRINYAV